MRRVIDQYSPIASQYILARDRPLATHVTNYNLQYYLGDLSGNNVLVLGCGSGVDSRLAHHQGAQCVIGVDLSRELLVHARTTENYLNHGIRYFEGDAATFPLHLFPIFHVVLMTFFLNYASCKDRLKQFLLSARSNLSDDGIILGMIPNPDRGVVYSGYGMEFCSSRTIAGDGTPFVVVMNDFDGTFFCRVQNFWWSKATFEQLFKETGFAYTWLEQRIAPAALKEYPEGFWDDLQERPLYAPFLLRLKNEG